MKNLLIQAASLIVLVSSLVAQEAPRVRKMPFAIPAEAGATPALEAEPKKRVTLSIKISKSTVAEAVEMVQQALEKQNQDRLNVVLNLSDAAAAQVPELALRNVTGSEALKLIATASGCEMGPVLAAQPGDNNPTGVIGWQIYQNLPAPRRMIVQPAPGPVSGAQQSSPNRLTRVYPLAELLHFMTFPDVAKTLLELFESDGITAKEAKVGFHEKSGILVVNGTDQAHVLVQEIINALRTNLSAKDQQNQELKNFREAANQEIKLRDAKVEALKKRAEEMELRYQKLEAEMKLLKNEQKSK